MRADRFILNVAAVAASTLATFAVLELAARAYLEHFAPEPRFVTYASYRQLEDRYGAEGGSRQAYAPHRYLGYYPTPGYEKGKNRHNALGYRGGEVVVPKPAGEFRIVCLGGSTTYDSDIEDWTLAYPSRLEHELGERGFGHVRVVNAGAAGWTSWESLIDFELRLLDLEPDLAIVHDALNDVHPRFVWPPELHRGDASGYRAANSIGLFMPSILEYSTVLRALMIRAGWVTPHADLSRTLDRLAPSYYGDLWRDQKRTGTYPSGVFKEVDGAKMLEANDTRYFVRNLENLVAGAKAHAVVAVLMSFPYSPEFPEEPRVSTPEYRRAIAEQNEALRELARRRDVALLDLATLFPSERRYYTDGRHQNEEGAALKARTIADFLVRERLVTAPAEPR